MPLSIEMNKIDTEYKSLSEVDPKIVRFYSEDVRTRVTGYTEPDEDGNVEQITEPYTVIVLNKPNEVSYEYVESRRGRRLGENVINQAITDAIAWEDFAVNHDGYLQWVEEHKSWDESEPMPDDEQFYLPELDGERVLNQEVFNDAHQQWQSGEPQRPVIDMNTRREVYTKIYVTHERDRWYPSSITTELVDDDKYTITTTSMGATDEDWGDFLANPSPEYIKHLKLTGVEFEGVMCSATKEDMWGLSSVESTVRAGHPVNFDFDSGETLVLTQDNIDAFQAGWIPFRMSFFQ